MEHINGSLLVGSNLLDQQEIDMEKIGFFTKAFGFLGIPLTFSYFCALSVPNMLVVTFCMMLIYNNVIDGLCKLKQTPSGTIDEKEYKKKNQSGRE